jgi:hypothetical protein
MTQGEMFSDLALEQQYDNMIKALDMKQETPEEAAKRYASHSLKEERQKDLKMGFIDGAKWQAERSQSIVPFDAYNIEVFAIKPDEQGKLFAYIGYKISNGNFHFSIVPFTEPKEKPTNIG